MQPEMVSTSPRLLQVWLTPPFERAGLREIEGKLNVLTDGSMEGIGSPGGRQRREARCVCQLTHSLTRVSVTRSPSRDNREEHKYTRNRITDTL